MGKITVLHYDVECDNNNNYIVYLKDQNELPNEIYDEISSTAVTISVGVTNPQGARAPAELVCERVKRILDPVWDLETLGIPAIKFNFNNCKRVANIFKHHPVFVFTTGITERSKAIELWEDSIRFLPKFTFLGSSDGKTFDLVTQDVNFACSWLDKYNTAADTSTGLKYDCDHLLKCWYNNGSLLEELRNDSFSAIAAYVVKANVNKYIPEYLTVPLYNVKRYRKAVSILSTKYANALIMSLQLPGKDYVVLFPIPE